LLLRGCDCVELTHKFTVPASVETTWEAFNDIEGVATCFPGAAVSSVEGDEFKGTCKVKLGLISLTYNGSGTFVEKDEAGRRFVVEAKGKDKRGNGTAAATVTATMSATSESSTDVEVLTDLSITGRPAQFGRGVIQDVSDKLLQQFMTCLEQKVSDASSAPAAEAEVPTAAPPAGGAEAVAAGAVAPEEAAATVAATAAAATEAVSEGPIEDGAGPAEDLVTEPAVTPTHGVEALDLGATVLPVLLRRYWMSAMAALAGLLGIVVLIRLIRRR